MSAVLDFTVFLVLACSGGLVLAQYGDNYSPAVPLRPVIPGAVPIGFAPEGAPRRPAFRAQARRVQPPPTPVSDPVGPPLRLRRPLGRAQRLPVAAPTPTLPPYQPSPTPGPSPTATYATARPVTVEEPLPPRPVVEEPEDLPNEAVGNSFAVSPSPQQPPVVPNLPPRQPAVQQYRPAPRPTAFRPERPPLVPTPLPDIDDYPAPTRQQYRGSSRPTTEAPQQEDEQQYSRAPPQYNRVQQAVRKQQYQKPSQQTFEKPQRQRKPVAQVLSKYREDNPDGSITWGFENDDGTFKEETIGIDCVTRGKYGYIDPDGVKREYSYASGLPCDKTRQDSEAQASEGYIDYVNNRYVLPNGDSVDLDNMVKNRARKPVYRN